MKKPQKKKVQRAFAGLAGSALAEVAKSDHTLRLPETPDRTDPIGFDEWWDSFGQRHAQIDLDCEFQPYAHDSLLRGAIPVGAHTTHGGGLNPEADMNDVAVLETFGIDPETTQDKRTGMRTGLLEGDRVSQLRRASPNTWWVFEYDLLRDFIKQLYDADRKWEASAFALVAFHYYYRSRQDQEIFAETDLFDDVKQLMNFRQGLIKEGSRVYAMANRPDARSRGQRQGRYVGGKKCNDPNCKCQSNEVSHDFTRR